MGVPTGAEEIAITQGSPDEARCVVAYGKAGRLVAAVAFNQAKWLETYQRLIEQAPPFPPDLPGVDHPPPRRLYPPPFPIRECPPMMRR